MLHGRNTRMGGVKCEEVGVVANDCIHDALVQGGQMPHHLSVEDNVVGFRVWGLGFGHHLIVEDNVVNQTWISVLVQVVPLGSKL